MNRAAVRLARFTIAVAALACSSRTPPSRLFLPPPSERWTRTVQIYDALDLNFHGHATYKSWEVREAALAAEARNFHRTPEETERRRKAEREDWLKHVDIYLSAFTPKRSWNDFHKKESRWTVYLRPVAGGRVPPLEIRRIDASEEPDFPEHADQAWSQTYLLRFPRPQGEDDSPLDDEAFAAAYQLVLTGPLGEARIGW